MATYEEVLDNFYAEAGLPAGWIDRVIHRFGTMAGLKGRERIRAALQIGGLLVRWG